MQIFSFVLTSINDMLDADIFTPETGWIALIVVLFLVLIILLSISSAKKSNNKIYGDDNNTSSIAKLSNVKIISKRTSPHPLYPTVMINYIVVECENGKRLEFAVKDVNIFGLIVEGDIGTLTYQGKKFIDFKRN